MGVRREFSKIKALFRRPNPTEELDEEIRSHLRMEERENLEAGLSAEEAHYLAMQRFGNITLAKERSKEMWQWTSVEGFLQDLRFGFRQLCKNPGFTTVAILTLALGIGANSAMFSAIDHVLLKPLPYDHPDRIVNLWEVPPPEKSLPRVPPPVGNYLDWRKMNHTLASLGAFTQTAFSLTSKAEPERYIGMLCDEGLFLTLGVVPVLGRAFTAEDNLPGRDTVAIAGYGFWKQRFGGDPNILGRQIILDGRARTIVGVMPEGFSPAQSVLWTPFGWSDELRSRRDWHDIRAVGRLKNGVSLTRARADFSAIAANLAREYPVFNKDEQIQVNPMMEDLVGQIRPAFLILLLAVTFVLLTACANVANLMLAKASQRGRELAVRASLGAGRLRILRQLLVESLLLSLAGGLASLLLAVALIRMIVAVAPASIPRIAGVHLDWRTFLFTLGLSLLTGVVFGMAPAWTASRADVHSLLKEGARGNTRQGRLRGALVVAQVAAAVILLAGAGLLIRSFYSVLRVDAGFDPDHVMTARLFPAAKYEEHPDLQIQLARNILHHVAALPGVENSAIASDIPIAGNPNFIMRLEGQEVTPSQAPITSFFSVTPSYFDTMGMRLLEGRLLNDRDIAGTPFVCVVNQSFARKFFPGQSSIGKRIEVTFRTPPRWREIVGVVADVHADGLDVIAPVQVYAAFLQIPGASLAFTPAITVVAKTKQNPGAMGNALKEAIYRADRSQPVFALQTMEEVVGKSVAGRRFALLLIAAFAVLALFLASLGIYGVISYSVTQRTAEIGIRMALGAKAGQVVWMIERQGLILVLIGLGFGTLAALGMTRFVKNMLFGIQPSDPLTFVSVAGVLLAVALIASYLPAWRASRIDPIHALRHD